MNKSLINKFNKISNEFSKFFEEEVSDFWYFIAENFLKLLSKAFFIIGFLIISNLPDKGVKEPPRKMFFLFFLSIRESLSLR